MKLSVIRPTRKKVGVFAATAVLLALASGGSPALGLSSLGLGGSNVPVGDLSGAAAEVGSPVPVAGGTQGATGATGALGDLSGPVAKASSVPVGGEAQDGKGAPDSEPKGPGASRKVECRDAGTEVGHEYERARAEEVGLDPDKVQKALDYWTTKNSTTVKVFRHGCLVDEGRLDPFYNYIPTHNMSQTKTWNALIVGRAQTLGHVDIDEPIGKHLSAEECPSKKHRALTLRDLLTQTSGLRMTWPNEANLTSPNRIAQACATPFDHEPGEHYEYAQVPLYLIGKTVQNAVGVDYQEFMDKEFLSKIGIPKSHYFWGRDRDGNSEIPGWLMFMTPIDFGRMGQLMLNEGVWHGERLIDAQYMRELHTGTEANGNYGFLTWLNNDTHWVNGSIFARKEHIGQPITSAPEDMYYSWGYWGQHVFVIPSLDMVVTRSGNLSPEQFVQSDPGNILFHGEQKEAYYTFFKLLMEAVTDKDLPEPPPFDPSPSLDFDPALWVSPEDNLALAQLGPRAPANCTVVGCGGDVAYKGSLQFVLDGSRIIPNSLESTAKTLGPALRERVLG